MSVPLVANRVLNTSPITNTLETSAIAMGFTLGGLCSETQVLDLFFSSMGSMSASSQLIPTAVPEPASLALLGLGVAAVAEFGSVAGPDAVVLGRAVGAAPRVMSG